MHQQLFSVLDQSYVCNRQLDAVAGFITINPDTPISSLLRFDTDLAYFVVFVTVVSAV